VNAGNANACTGDGGLLDAREMATLTTEALGLGAGEVLVASTGVVGDALPMDAVRRGIGGAVEELERGGNSEFPSAILTTDTVRKEYALEFDVGGETVRIGGCCKGAGMISPNMATMLAFVTTDAGIAPSILETTLRTAVGRTFNCISIDGDQSTNDTVFALASGRAATITTEHDLAVFGLALESVCRELALQIVRDGEGTTRVIEVRVRGAKDDADARLAARAIGESLLVKTAVYGNDPNWGRVLVALGYSGADFDPGRVAMWIEDLQVVRGGIRADYAEGDAETRLRDASPVRLTVGLDVGDADATFWSSDLTEAYVRENSVYRT
jgi:glutamate N-acetyltransferase/amino-acid N-acetyltransferase